MYKLLQKAKMRLERLFGVQYPGSATYWDRRYSFGGTSGAGSFGRLALFKAEFLNDFVAAHGVTSVVELGCGDGSQLTLAKYPHYTGIDVSREAIKRCRRIFAEDNTKTFAHSGEALVFQGKYELALSLDVIFHLTEDSAYEIYMRRLFSLSDKLLVIYSSNISNEDFLMKFPFYNSKHVKHRAFVHWVERNMSGWKLVEVVNNRFPFDEEDPEQTSFSDFYVFKKL